MYIYSMGYVGILPYSAILIMSVGFCMIVAAYFYNDLVIFEAKIKRANEKEQEKTKRAGSMVASIGILFILIGFIMPIFGIIFVICTGKLP